MVETFGFYFNEKYDSVFWPEMAVWLDTIFFKNPVLLRVKKSGANVEFCHLCF